MLTLVFQRFRIISDGFSLYLIVTSPYKGIVLLPQAFRKKIPIKTVVCPFVASSSKVWDDDQKCMNMFPNLYVAVLPPFF
jgi:hypothetical protein